MKASRCRAKRCWMKCGACAKTRTRGPSITLSCGCGGISRPIRGDLCICRLCGASDTNSWPTRLRSCHRMSRRWDTLDRIAFLAFLAILDIQLFMQPVLGLANSGDFSKVTGRFGLYSPAPDYQFAPTTYVF